MSFADLAATHERFKANHVFGEIVGYKRSPGTGFVQIQALVERDPADFTGQVQAGKIRVRVSADQLPIDAITPDSDQVKIWGRKAGTYTVRGEPERGSGYVTVTAIK